MRDIVDEARREGLDRALVGQVIGDVKTVLKIQEVRHPLPRKSVAINMAGRYDPSVFTEERFGEGVALYGDIIKEMVGGRFPYFERKCLVAFKVRLSHYYDSHMDF